MNEYPRGEQPAIVHIDELPFFAEEKPKEVDDWGEDEACQPSEDDYADEGPDAPKRFGNNRKHVKKSVAKARRKIAKKSKQRNRK